MSNKLMLSIGFGNFVVKGEVRAIIQPNSAPVRRFIKQKFNDGKVIDATMGKKLRAVVILSSDHIVLSGISVSSLITRSEDG